MPLRILTVPSSSMTDVQAEDVIRLCGGVFNIDYAYLMNLCPVRTHVLGYLEDQLVAHALWLDRPMRIGNCPWFTAAYVEGVATDPDYRRLGYGEAVMRRLQDEIAGYPLGVLSPAVEPWYVRLGWERWSGTLWIDKDSVTSETLDETVLICRTPITGVLDGVPHEVRLEWRRGEAYARLEVDLRGPRASLRCWDDRQGLLEERIV